MGALLPNPNDLDVIAQLNQRFSGAQLAWIRAQYVNDQMFGAGRTLRRSAWRLYIWPSSIPRAKARWLWFLSSGLSQTNQNDIKTILEEGIHNTAGNIDGVLFDAVADSTLRVGNYTVERQQILADTATQDVFLKIVLHCGADIPANQAGDGSEPPAEAGEVGGDHPSPFAARPLKASSKKTHKRKQKTKKTTKGKRRTKRK
jgi:hypothetical protein